MLVVVTPANSNNQLASRRVGRGIFPITSSHSTWRALTLIPFRGRQTLRHLPQTHAPPDIYIPLYYLCSCSSPYLSFALLISTIQPPLLASRLPIRTGFPVNPTNGRADQHFDFFYHFLVRIHMLMFRCINAHGQYHTLCTQYIYVYSHIYILSLWYMLDGINTLPRYFVVRTKVFFYIYIQPYYYIFIF